MKTILGVEVKNWREDDFVKGEFIEYNDEIYTFLGYDYGTYPIIKHIETEETIELPYY